MGREHFNKKHMAGLVVHGIRIERLPQMAKGSKKDAIIRFFCGFPSSNATNYQPCNPCS